MSGRAQVWHIVKKDVRQFRWLLAAYLVLVVAATAGAVTGGQFGGGYLQLAAVLLLVVGPLTAASLVQADSPTRAEAFWASRPFRGTAMFGAKLATVVGVLLVLPLVGQWLALIALTARAADIAVIMAKSAMLYAFILLVAMFVAGLTRDMRSFVLGAVAWLIVSVAWTAAASQLYWQWDPTSRVVVAAIGFLGAFVLLGLLYQRRNVRGGRALGVFTLALILLASVSSGVRMAPAGDRVAVDNRPGAAGIAVELRDTAQISRAARVNLWISLTNAAGSRQFSFLNVRAHFFLRDGTTVDIPVGQLGSRALTGGSMALPGISSLQADEYAFSGPSQTVSEELTADQRRALMRGIDSVRITSQMTVHEPRIFATLALRVGAGVRRDGRAVRIEDVALRATDEILTLRMRSVEGFRNDVDWMNVGSDFRVYLINQQRGEGVSLLPHGSSSNPGLLVLPGAGVHDLTVRYNAPRTREGDLYLADAEWLSGAKLMLVTWTPVATYEVSASSVPLPPKILRGRRSAPVSIGVPETILPERR